MNPLEPLYYNNKAACYIETKRYEDVFLNKILFLKAIAACDEGLKVISESENKNYTKLAKLFARKAKALYLSEKLSDAVIYYEKSLLEDNIPSVREELRKV